MITLRSRTVRSASLRVTVPAILLVKHKGSVKRRQRPRVLQRLSVTVTDVSRFSAVFSLF